MTSQETAPFHESMLLAEVPRLMLAASSGFKRNDQQPQKYSRHRAMPATPAHSKAVGPDRFQQAVKPSSVVAETTRQHHLAYITYITCLLVPIVHQTKLTCLAHPSIHSQRNLELDWKHLNVHGGKEKCDWRACYGKGDRPTDCLK